MKDWQKAALCAAAIVLAADLAQSLASTCPTETPSIQANHSQGAKEGCSLLQMFSIRAAGWFVGFVDEFEGFVTAGATVAIAIFTATLWAATKRLMIATGKIGDDANKAAERTSANFAAAERAYVKMSHLPHGLHVDRKTGNAYVRIEIKNRGRTPATVTDALLAHEVVKTAEADFLFAAEPAYDRPAGHGPTNAFLAQDDKIFVTFSFKFGPLELALFDSAEHVICVHGYVDYIDRFGVRQRGGYARTYDPTAAEGANNLVFRRGLKWNYDRKRKPGEGNDWPDQKA